MLVRPNKTPCIKNHCRCSDTAEFTDNDIILVGPFKFAEEAPGIAPDQFFPDAQWEELAAAYHKHGIIPSHLSFDPVACTNTVSICNTSVIVP